MQFLLDSRDTQENEHKKSLTFNKKHKFVHIFLVYQHYVTAS
jgi:hypothetical protein